MNRLFYQAFSFEAQPVRVPIVNEKGEPEMQEIVAVNITPMEQGPDGRPIPMGIPIELWFQPDKWDKFYQDGKGSKLAIVRDVPA